MMTAVVTGANTGIGREIARGLARQGTRVILACRDDAKGEAARAFITADIGKTPVELVHLDLASLDSVRQCAAEIKKRVDRLDVLVNNAGVSVGSRRRTPDGIEWDLGVNHVGPFLFTNLLLDLLKRSAPSRIVTVASAMHRRAKLDFDDFQAARGWTMVRAYSVSKLHNVLFTYELARKLAGTGVTVNCMNPGLVRSELYRSFTNQPLIFRMLLKLIGRTPEKGAETAVFLALEPSLVEITGAYYDNLKPVRSSKITYDDSVARKSWEVTERLAGLLR